MISIFRGLKERIMGRRSSSPCGLGGFEIEDILIRADFGNTISSKMDNRLGLRSFDSDGYYLEVNDQLSQNTLEEIDAAINRIVVSAYADAREIVLNNRDKLEAIAAKLLERETLVEKCESLNMRPSGVVIVRSERDRHSHHLQDCQRKILCPSCMRSNISPSYVGAMV
jgi:hypothetical protein